MSRFDDLSEEGKVALQREFDNPDTPTERRVELLTFLQEGADEAEMGRPCPRCRHYPFYAPHDEALVEGHIYSPEGLAEREITGYCEYCFDEVTREPEDAEF